MVFSGLSPAPPRWAKGMGWGQSRNSPFPMYGFGSPHGADRGILRTVRQPQHRQEPPMDLQQIFDATGYQHPSDGPPTAHRSHSHKMPGRDPVVGRSGSAPPESVLW